MRIAVVERGGKCNDEESTPHTSFEHEHESIVHLQHWFRAAHYTSRSNSTNESFPTVLHSSTPQVFLHNRILDVPTGRGWGGSTNIHAGLFIPPQSSDFDAWPGNWKERVMKGVDHVMDVFKKEGAIEVSHCIDVIAEVNENGDTTFEPITASSIQSKRMEVERILISNNSDSTEDNEQTHHRGWGVECAVTSNKSMSINSTEKEYITLQATSQITIQHTLDL
eukprot:scaffold52590_cov23-Cyclotella_meneghiniana.AAC.3